MKILITICGRAGSKGCLNKNIKQFNGHPLILYTIATANLFKKSSKDSVYIAVNSDSEELLKIASETNCVTCIKRPSDLAGDCSPKIPSIQYTVRTMEKQYNTIYDYVIDLDITSPLRTVEDIRQALENCQKYNLDTVFSVVKSRRNPYFNMVEGDLSNLKKIKTGNFVRRQDAPTSYDMNASIYCYSRDSLINKLISSPLEGNYGGIEMIDTNVIDIDSEEDFTVLELLYSYYSKYFIEMQTEVDLLAKRPLIF